MTYKPTLLCYGKSRLYAQSRCNAVEVSCNRKRALWDPRGGSPLFSMDGLGTKHSSLVPTVWNYCVSVTVTSH